MREEAERTVEALRASLAECESTLAAEKRTDLVRRVKGKSSLEQAIEDARRMVEVLKRAEAELAEGDGPGASGREPGAEGPGASAFAEPKPGWRSIGAVGEARSSEPSVGVGAGEDEETPLAGVIGVFGRSGGVSAAAFSRRATVMFSRP